jgi:hypothetical protein
LDVEHHDDDDDDDDVRLRATTVERDPLPTHPPSSAQHFY